MLLTYIGHPMQWPSVNERELDEREQLGSKNTIRDVYKRKKYDTYMT